MLDQTEFQKQTFDTKLQELIKEYNNKWQEKDDIALKKIIETK